jgi:hypothetical protein
MSYYCGGSFNKIEFIVRIIFQAYYVAQSYNYKDPSQIMLTKY